jgi:deoxyribodipyrimidine photo-lyase
MAQPIIVWFRQDLRLSDNAALEAAVASGAPIIPLFVLDDVSAGDWKLGSASRWWLHHSLASLANALIAKGSQIILRRGPANEVVPAFVQETRAAALHWSRGHDPVAKELEPRIDTALAKLGVVARRFAGALLFEPTDITTNAGVPFRVFTPFWRACLERPEPAEPRSAPRRLTTPINWPVSDVLEDWRLLPTSPDWAGGLRETWQPGEDGAKRRLAAFVKSALANYATGRDRPDKDGTSQLSPHLHFGEVSPSQCWHAARAIKSAPAAQRGINSFRRELGWREFSAYLLYHWRDLPNVPFRAEFKSFPWKTDGQALVAWQRGQTGYPIVDAGMRQLWKTGWMHNRVRMIVASFLIKDLLIPWQTGEAWFWDTLVDADLANNAQGWQWVAGSGADAAPYFRIFNPVTQGKTHDPNGDYVRRFVPELKHLPVQHIHAPWNAPEDVLAEANIVLGSTYPRPIVDHALARREALTAFATMKER